jgi:hypothetical protein
LGFFTLTQRRDGFSSDRTASTLKDVLQQVRRDEAEAISLLASLLDNVRETSNTAPLERISKIVVQWQNVPPGVIVTELRTII